MAAPARGAATEPSSAVPPPEPLTAAGVLQAVEALLHERVLKHAEKVRTIVKAMDGSECVRVADEQRAALEETVARVAPLAPTEADYDSDDYA